MIAIKLGLAANLRVIPADKYPRPDDALFVMPGAYREEVSA